jgi:archaeal flagellar protein FlaG
MSSETIVNALFLITAVVAAGILINAIMPAIYRTSETFGSTSHEADTRMRTDIKIVNTYAKHPDAKIWLKNIGNARVARGDLDYADVFIGAEGDFERVSLAGKYTIEDQIPVNQFWNPGETLSITVESEKIPAHGEITYFSLVLPNGVKASETFTAY